MKFTAICAIVGAASASTQATKVYTPYVESPCDKTRNAYWNARREAENGSNYCEQNGWKAYTPPAVQPGQYVPHPPWNACFPDRVEASRKTQDDLRPAYRVCQIAEDRKHLLENGIDVEHDSNHHGDISASINWQHLGNYAHQWADWFEGQSQSKEAQEIAMHLNNAAKKMVNSIAGGQAAAVRNAGKLIGSYTKWLEPGSKCNADAFAKCLQEVHHPGMNYPRHFAEDLGYHVAFENKDHQECAKDNDCDMRMRMSGELKGPKHHEHKHELMKDGERTGRAVEKMTHEIQQDVMGEMMSQRHNAETVVKDFLTEANKEYKAWGCEPKCVDDATRKLHRLHHIKHCDCPATVTISGDTSVIFQ